MTQAHPTPLTTWRNLARRFHCIDFMIRAGRLPAELEPKHLASRLRKGATSRAEASVFRFLLHVWNPNTRGFCLADTLGWDREHLAALAAWATGEVTGEPGHYFHYYAGGRG